MCHGKRFSTTYTHRNITNLQWFQVYFFYEFPPLVSFIALAFLYDLWSCLQTALVTHLGRNALFGKLPHHCRWHQQLERQELTLQVLRQRVYNPAGQPAMLLSSRQWHQISSKTIRQHNHQKELIIKLRTKMTKNHKFIIPFITHWWRPQMLMLIKYIEHWMCAAYRQTT